MLTWAAGHPAVRSECCKQHSVMPCDLGQTLEKVMQSAHIVAAVTGLCVVCCRVQCQDNLSRLAGVWAQPHAPAAFHLCACDSFCLQPAALLPVATHIYTCNMLFAACSISCFGQTHSKCQCYSTTPHVMCALPVAVEHAHAMIVPASCCPLLPAELQAWAGEWCSSQDG